VEIHHLKPERRPSSVDDVLDSLGLSARDPVERPHVLLNMISTLDGRASVDGRTRGLGNGADRALFHGLRARVDAVMVGAGTARAERYGTLVRSPETRRWREDRGLKPLPLAVLVSGRLDLPEDLPLLQDPESLVVVATSSADSLPAVPAEVAYLRFEGTVDLERMLRYLWVIHGVRSLLCEGGPTLNAPLLKGGLVDELFLSFAPLLLGGDAGLRIVGGPELEPPHELELLWCLQSGDHLFTRWRVPGSRS